MIASGFAVGEGKNKGVGAGRQKLHVPPVSGYWQSCVCLQQTGITGKAVCASSKLAKLCVPPANQQSAQKLSIKPADAV